MNIERLTKIVEWLEKQADDKYVGATLDMASFSSNDAGCGTTFCIAGYAIHRWSRIRNPEHHRNPDVEAALLLELNSAQVLNLFYGYGAPCLDEIDAAWAARCVRKLIATGVVDWRRTEAPNGRALHPVEQDGGQFYDKERGGCIANYGDTGDFARAVECRKMFEQQHPGYYVSEGDD